MKVWEDFVACYANKKFRACAEILHRLISQQIYNDDLSEEWLPIFVETIRNANERGHSIKTREEFLAFQGQILKEILDGPNNPTVNN